MDEIWIFFIQIHKKDENTFHELYWFESRKTLQI